ncbi:MAG TPA: TAT-variant-translocated molybdopterin oxidoreductase [Vicinamibacterales bacterium]|nr:TAT-variant-translocated molybdopterin oxidoreductase [Vicinamibacterales bacterium]
MSTTERDSGFGIRDSHGEPGNRGSHGAGSGRPNSSESRLRTPDSRFFWRTLEERLGDPDFQRHLCNEFPSLLPTIEQVADPVARRTFLKLMGASLALAGVSACTRQPVERIVPYVRQPEELVPGKPLFYATAMTIGGVATGLLVESHEGRPTKIEGNPLHPGSLGSSDVFAQAAILGLYDPDRSQTLTNLGDIRPWSAFLGAMNAALTAQRPLRGAGVRLLTESVGSPTLAAQIRDVLSRYPDAKWHQWDPASRNNARVGARLAFGDFVDTQYRFDQADVILAFDADFLGCGPASLRHARDFAARRRPGQADRMNRLYAIESMPTSTGSRADHRLPARPGEIEAIARQIAAALGVGSGQGTSAGPDRTAKFVAAVAKDLQAHRGRSIVIAGDGQPAAVHALAHAINQSLGNVGTTVVHTQTAEAEPVDQIQSLRDLVAAMNAGRVDLLVMLGGNPVYSAPADLNFDASLSKVQMRVHLSQHVDETAALCHWHIPEAHFLEAWSDARAFDGTVSIVQPLIAPLYGGKSAHEVLASMSDRPERSAHDLIREFWKVDKDDRTWRRWLHDGVVANTAFPAKSVTAGAAPAAARPAAQGGGLEINFRNDPSILDGRFANNGWLQELPKPITRLTWDNAVIVSPATAAALRHTEHPAFRGGEHGQIITDIVELRYRGRTIRGPLFEVAGHPDGCATVHLGYGRARGGKLAVGAGFNANAIRTADAPEFGEGLEIVQTGGDFSLACTQYHHLMNGRGMVRALTRDEFVKNPRAIHEGEETPPRTVTLYPNYEYAGYRWGMAIDINACIGCNACVVGCQAENNIPVVGKNEVLSGREMHWIRVDTYYRGEESNPETYFQPVPCMQCENAPCEVVCPVGATVHSHEGLNDMVYNRCVGTRYCSDNCPYKVRRFNFLLYQDWNTPSLKLARNPDVSVRSRGVMEKCTYCVQRINRAKIDAEQESRPVRDTDIQTACQQACPADAIVFGNLNDPASRVAQLQAEERNYSLIGELNTRPRTTYLAAIRNVNPELEG